MVSLIDDDDDEDDALFIGHKLIKKFPEYDIDVIIYYGLSTHQILTQLSTYMSCWTDMKALSITIITPPKEEI